MRIGGCQRQDLGGDVFSQAVGKVLSIHMDDLGGAGDMRGTLAGGFRAFVCRQTDSCSS